MAKGPAVVIIARHGARLDAADNQWHLTSPTPYDPPLTYGGWSQGKALGLRIAALLQQRENERTDDAKSSDVVHLDSNTPDAGKGKTGSGIGQKRKKHRIIIHSSPYLRCIQTSTAVAAGLSQFQPGNGVTKAGTGAVTKLNVPTPSKGRNGQLGASPLAKSTAPTVQRMHTMQSTAGTNIGLSTTQTAGPEKILLRIDAFLGEWLSPDYFEDITPPPNSTMMVAGAKADLLRRGDYVEVPAPAPSSKGHFPGGWVKTSTPTTASSRKDTKDVLMPFPKLGSLAQALPARERSSSQGNSFLRRRSRSRESVTTPALSTPHKLPSNIYEAPVPSYSVSPADPIPRGYVAHARDACVGVDFQWDSMREPQEWGDGGEYGDEWSTMHKRFRRGLAGMMKWYKEHRSMLPTDPIPGFTFNERPKTKHSSTDPLPRRNENPEGEEDEGEDEELVLVLITHGAGCNALLGAISNQPILIDVGLAALSMAVRREEPRTPSTALYQRRSSIVDPGMSDTYEMKILASTNHLRLNVDPSKPPQAQSPAGVASPSLEYRRRFRNGSGSANSPVDKVDSLFSSSDSVRSGWNSALGSVRRSSLNNGSGTTRPIPSYAPGPAATPRPSSGLWSNASASSNFSPSDASEAPGSHGENMLLNFGNQFPKSSESAATLSSNPPPSSIPNMDGTSTVNPQPSVHINAAHDAEKEDDVAPLRSSILGPHKRVPSVNGAGGGAGGLWTPNKASTGVNKLWGPPRLEEVYEHRHGPKRRWTVNETAE